MQYVVRVEQRIAMCQSMCSEPLSSTSATTRMFTVLPSGRFCLQNLLGSRRRRCSLSPLTKLSFGKQRALIITRCEINLKVWFCVVWFGVAWPGLAWPGLAWLGLAWRSVSVSKSCKFECFEIQIHDNCLSGDVSRYAIHD